MDQNGNYYIFFWLNHTPLALYIIFFISHLKPISSDGKLFWVKILNSFFVFILNIKLLLVNMTKKCEKKSLRMLWGDKMIFKAVLSLCQSCAGLSSLWIAVSLRAFTKKGCVCLDVLHLLKSSLPSINQSFYD